MELPAIVDKTDKMALLAEQREATLEVEKVKAADRIEAYRKRQEAKKALEPNIRIPESWGKLPDTAKWIDEVEWVHQQRILVIGTTKSGDIRLDWHQATLPAPSKGAMALMKSVAENPQWFDKDILPKAKRVGEAVEENVEQVKKSVAAEAEIEEILVQMRAAARERYERDLGRESATPGRHFGTGILGAGPWTPPAGSITCRRTWKRI
jgi:hypothetical protein